MDGAGNQAGVHRAPRGSRPLWVSMKDSNLCLWMEVDEDAERVPFEFVVVGTGHGIPEHSKYVGSTFDGDFVWHVYMTAEDGMPLDAKETRICGAARLVGSTRWVCLKDPHTSPNHYYTAV